MFDVEVVERQPNGADVFVSLLYPERAVVVGGILERVVVRSQVAASLLEAVVTNSLRNETAGH